MEVTDGNLSWAATLDISGISKAKDKLVKYFKDMGLSAEEAGKRADEAMQGIEDALSEATGVVESHTDAIEVLNAAYEEIQKQIEGMEDGEAKEIMQGIADGIANVVSEVEAMNQVDAPIDELGEEAVSARQQLREMTEELVNMKMRGEENTEAYQQLLEKVGVLKDAMADTQQAVKGMASDTAALDSVLGAAQLTAGGFSAIIGAMNLVGAGEDTKELAEAQKKLQAAIAVTTGLQSVQNALQKQSALMLGIQKIQTLAAAKAEDIRTAATGRGVIATKAATVAQKAFNAVAKANPYVLLAMAILTVVGALAAFTSGAKENERQQKSLNDELERQLDILNRLNGVYNTQQSNEINNLRNILDLLKAQGASIDAIRDAEDQLDNAEEARIKREKEDYKDLLDHAQEYEDKLEELRLKAQETNNEGNAARETAWPEYSPFSDYSTWEVPNQHPNWIKDHADALVDATVEDLETYEKIVAKIHQIQQDDENYQNRMRIKEANRLAEDKERRDKEAREAAERRQKNLEEERRYQEDLRQARERAEDLELGNGSDNINTRVAKVELEYDRQIAEAERKADEARANNKLELAEQYERQVSALMKKRDAEINQLYADEEEAQEQALADMLDNYKGYDQKRREIENRYAADIKKLEEKRDEFDEGSEERLQYEQAIAEAQRQQSEELTDLEVEYGKLARLEARRAQLEKQIILAWNSGDKKQLEELRKALEAINKEIDDFSKSTEEETPLDWWNETKKGIIVDGLDAIAESLGKLAEATGNLNAQEASDFMSALSRGVQGFQNGGWIGVLIAGIQETLAAITDLLVSSEAVQSAIENAQIEAWINRIESILNNEGIFGENPTAKLNASLDVINEIEGRMEQFSRTSQTFAYDFNRYLEATNLLSWRNWAAAFTEVNNNVLAYWEALDKGYSKMEAHVFRTNNRSWLANFFGIDDQYDNLKDIVEGLGYELYDEYGNLNRDALQAILDTYTDLTEEDRRWIEEAIAYSDEYAEAMQNIADYIESLFGNVADTIADQFIESFLESGQAAMDFDKVMSDVAKNMVKNLIKSAILDNVMNGYAAQFKNIMLSGEYESQEQRQAALLGLFAQMGGEIEALQPYIQSLLEAYQSFIGDIDSETTAMSGNLLQSASQESVDLLNGQLNAIRTNQSFMASRVDEVLMQLTGIRNDMNNGFNRSVQHLENIDNNTSEGGSILRQLGIWIG